ncbi:hypothetical protein BAE44_0004455 [Dichanthelium oligosanthes]|uniref:RNase H type-1 domain-containing protein n=1 Tax=Dichanthelium oligosanthes TaxID=888268 RepID=A0A1E5WAS1_9POAL|nr:hypothetical protein BAE44_0004455 [Dichanthelium oligosanthes]
MCWYSAGWGNYLLDAFQSEVLACMAGITAASHLGMVHVIAETDSLILMNAPVVSSWN